MFSCAKIGDKVWSIRKGWGEITKIDKDSRYPIEASFGVTVCSFGFDGKEIYSDKYPTLFWDEIKFEIPEKPFSLEYEMKKLKVKKFKFGEENCFISWNNQSNTVGCESFFRCRELPGLKYFTFMSVMDFMKAIEDKKITKEEFFRAYNNVFGGN